MTPAELRALWDERDRRYSSSFESARRADIYTRAVQDARAREARAIGDAELELEARRWFPPMYVPKV